MSDASVSNHFVLWGTSDAALNIIALRISSLAIVLSLLTSHAVGDVVAGAHGHAGVVISFIVRHWSFLTLVRAIFSTTHLAQSQVS
jgi:hypothetical protein